MEIVGAYEAKTHLPKLLKKVTEGNSIVITKHGLPVAVLSPFESKKNTNIKLTIAEIKKHRELIANKSVNVSISEMIKEGRK